MAKGDFVHLHLHSEYSLLDGLGTPKAIVKKVKELGMNAVALTDHGAMYGAIEFYKAARDADIKPIIGVEAYVVNASVSNQDHKTKGKDKTIETYHLILLAKNEEGYKNLMKLTSIAHLEGYYYRPKFDKEILAKHAKGLICLSGCTLSEIPQYLIADNFEKAKKTASWYQELFGNDYYLEIQRHEYEKFVKEKDKEEIKNEMRRMADSEKKVIEGVLRLSKDLGIPTVATNDSHYINPDDADAQDAMVCVATGKVVSDIKRIRFKDAPTLYIRAKEEMNELFADIPDAVKNTVRVAEKCELEISTLGKWFFPKFPLPNGVSSEEHLRKLVYEGLREKYPKEPKEIKERIEKELQIIIDKGFAPYFLIVSDMAQWAKNRGIITNTRGSAAGSVVSYILGITTVDPIKYYLPFERFLNLSRPTPPDIDLDVADNRREEVIAYMVQTYGKDKVAQICTFGRMLARAAVRDVARVLDYPYAVGDRIAKVIPPPKQGFPVDIPKALTLSPQLSEMYKTDRDARRILDLAHKVEGNARHVSVHAAAVVVSPTEITDFTPLQLEPGGEKIITQYEMHAIDDVGLIKFDILGITNLSILGACVEIVKKTQGYDVDLSKIPLDDKKTFAMLSQGETLGVFQMGSSGMTRYLIELKPTRVEDLMAMVALYRPGPIDVIPEYIARKHEPERVKYMDPRMKKFLDSSYGLLVYQDDLLFCCIELAGYTWEEADKFRKAVGKKIPAEMAAQKDKFIKGVIDNGQTKEFAEKLWKLFEPFQAYGFNKAHAASYGLVAYQTAYMKANYPVEYMCALMTADSGDTDKVAQAVVETRRMGINVLPPDVNESDEVFTIVTDKSSKLGRAIRFGLSAIKNVGEAAQDAILSVRRKTGKYVSLSDFCQRVDARKVNKKVIESLIKSGAMDSFGKRASLLAAVEDIRSKVNRETGAEGQGSLFEESEEKTATGKLYDKLPEVSDFSQEEKLDLEKQLLGLYLTANPLMETISKLTGRLTHKLSELTQEEHSGQMIKIGGMVSKARTVLTKNGAKEMAFVTLGDGTGSIDAVVFPKVFARTKLLWGTKGVLVVEGKVEYREESLSLIVEQVRTADEELTQVGQDTPNVLRIPRGTNPQALLAINQLLQANKGEDDVVIIVENGYGEKKINLPYGVSWTQTLQEKIRVVLSQEH